MLGYLLKRLGYALITLWGVVTVVFFLFVIIPGDPAQMMLGQNESEEQLQQVREKYGFDKPVWEQYLLYLNDLSPISVHSIDPADYTYDHGQYDAVPFFALSEINILLKQPYLRTSFQKSGKPVTKIIAETLPNTLILALSAIIIALLLGLTFGVVSALKKNTWLDRFLQVISTMGMSLPSFFSAILAAWFFGYLLHEYTGLSMNGNLYELDDYGEAYHFHPENLILPALVLGIRPLAVILQLMRNSLLEVLNQEYITAARAKGLSEFQVVMGHAFKNALNPVVTAVSGWFAGMLAGAVFVEYIFNWNGLGKEIVEALNTLDLPVITGAVIVIACLFILLNIVVDIIYALLDPRVRLN